MFKEITTSIIQKIGIIILVTSIMVIIILNTPEDSNLQLFIVFAIGGLFEYGQPIMQNKIDLMFRYLMILIFCSVWFFIVPNKIQSIMFILGVYFTKHIQLDLNQLSQRANIRDS